MLSFDEVWHFIACLPNLSGVWDKKYVHEDCQNGFQQPWLNRLAENPDKQIQSELGKLDSYLGKVINYKGFNKLLPGLRAHEIEYFSSTIAEVKSDAWIANYHELVEIRPVFTSSKNEADFKLTLAGRDLYGEVWEARDLPTTRIIDAPFPAFMTDQRTEEPKRLRTLRQKGNAQLPSSVIGIWVAHIYYTGLQMTFVDTFAKDMANRPNVLGVALWVRAALAAEFSELCIRCHTLADEGHDIYWLGNEHCEHKCLQRKFLCSIID